MEDKIREAIDRLRPFIQSDGGDIDFVSYDTVTKTVYVALQGACVGCPSSIMTLKFGVERAIKQAVPEVEFVEAY